MGSCNRTVTLVPPGHYMWFTPDRGTSVKTLWIVRHAKSSWSDPGLRDFDRPLNRRGTRDAGRMGRFLARQGDLPQRLLASTARRAWDTAELIARGIGYSADDILPQPDLYDASVGEMLAVIHDIDQTHASVMLFSHNPGVTDLTNALTGSSIGNVPTCGVARVTLDVDTWTAVKPARGKLVSFYVPKELDVPG